MIDEIMMLFGACLLLLLFSDGIKKGFEIVLFLTCIFGLPVYFMIKLDSITSGALGFIVGIVFIITYSVIDEMINNNDK